MLKYLLLMFIFNTIQTNCFGETDICDNALNLYSNSSTDFIGCYLQLKTQPIMPCVHCVHLYRDAKLKFQNLTKINNANSKACIDLYINNDKYNILLTINDFIDTLWNKGDCTDCFDWADDLNIPIPNLSNLTLEFNTILNHTLQCIKNTDLIEICSKCVDKYLILNNFYNHLSKTKHNQICFDSKSQMNKTRLHWSKDLNCCKDKKDSMLIFTILGGIFGALFLLFYTFNFIYTKRNENNYYLIATNLPTQEISSNDNYNSDTNQHSQSVATSSPLTVNKAITHNKVTNKPNEDNIDLLFN